MLQAHLCMSPSGDDSLRSKPSVTLENDADRNIPIVNFFLLLIHY